MTALTLHLDAIQSPASIQGQSRSTPAAESEGGHIQGLEDIRDLIRCAADCTGKTSSAFIRDALLDAAEGAVLHQAMFGLTEDQFRTCEEILSRPLSENVGYQRMMARKAPWEL